MNNTTEFHIRSKINGAQKLNYINTQLANWDLSPIEGQGFYYGASYKYGHIKIKMYKSQNGYSQIIWNLIQTQLPDEYGAKEVVKDVLSFFISYMEGIRGECIPITFEINDGTYHAVDSHKMGYSFATLHALIDCFVPGHIDFPSHRVVRNPKNGQSS